MKDPLQRKKVVIRHLPSSLSQSDLLTQIDARFSNRYNWFSFCHGKSSYTHQRYSRAYIDFKRPEDVFEFAEFFDRYVFVNEKGTQFKTIVEYASSQRVPKQCTKMDSREGTIYKDPDYLEFLKLIVKPVENLPSAEIQLERKEAEQTGVVKETPIVTPLMEFVRQKRSARSGAQGFIAVGKVSKRAGVTSTNKLGSKSTKRRFEKKKYILKDDTKNTSRKGKSTCTVMHRRDDQPAVSSGKEMSENETVSGIDSSRGITLTTDSGKKKILLLKTKQREIPIMAQGMSQQQGATSSAGNLALSTASRQNQRSEASGRLIRSIPLNNEACQSQSSTAAVQPHQKIQPLNLGNGKRPPRPVDTRSGLNSHVSNNEPSAFNSNRDTKRDPDDKFIKKDMHGLGTTGEKKEKHARNKDRPDRVWTPLRHSDVLQTSEELLPSSALQPTQSLPDFVEVTQGEMKDGIPSGRTLDLTGPSSGRHVYSMEKGSYRHGHRLAAQNMKDDGSLITEGKSSKIGGATRSSAHEKQMWVQKSSVGS